MKMKVLSAEELKQKLSPFAGLTRGIADAHSEYDRSYEDRAFQQLSERCNQLRAEVSEACAKAGQRIAGWNFSVRMEKVRQAPAQLARDRGREIDGWQRELDSVRKTLEAAKRDLKSFKNEHGIAREPQFSDRNRWFLVWIFVLVLFECFLNSTLFGLASEFGLLGGLVVALMVALINIGLAGCAASALRYFWYRVVAVRVVALIGVLLVLASEVLVALFVGHYRRALETNPQSANEVAVQTMAHDALAVGSFHSWILMMVTAVFFALAWWKFYRADDPYPGYGYRVRKALQHEHLWNEAQDQFAANMAQWNNAAIEQFNRDLLSLQSACHEARETRGEIDEWNAQLASWTKQQQHAFSMYCEELRRFYRDEVRNLLNISADRIDLAVDQLTCEVASSPFGKEQRMRAVEMMNTLDAFLNSVVPGVSQQFHAKLGIEPSATPNPTAQLDPIPAFAMRNRETRIEPRNELAEEAPCHA